MQAATHPDQATEAGQRAQDEVGTMRAIVQRAYGSSETLHLGQIDRPTIDRPRRHVDAAAGRTRSADTHRRSGSPRRARRGVPDRRGELRADLDLDATARAVNALMIAVGDSQLLPYLNNYFRVSDEDMPLERVVDALVEMLLHGLT